MYPPVLMWPNLHLQLLTRGDIYQDVWSDKKAFTWVLGGGLKSLSWAIWPKVLSPAVLLLAKSLNHTLSWINGNGQNFKFGEERNKLSIIFFSWWNYMKKPANVVPPPLVKRLITSASYFLWRQFPLKYSSSQPVSQVKHTISQGSLASSQSDRVSF